MENEETEWENINNNTTNTTDSSQNTSNTENTVETNTTTEVVVSLDESEQLAQIHEDLGFICCFIIFFVIVILCKYAYKFFDMFFPI